VPAHSFQLSFPCLLYIPYKMPCSSTLSASATTKLNARINELINDGCSDSEIVREIRREAKSPKCAWPDMSFSRIKKLIDAAMEEAENSSESSAPTFESDEEDEEYVPSEESEDEDEDEEDEEDEDEEDEEESEELKSVIIYMDRHETTEIDRLTITPQGDGLFYAELAYDLKSSSAYPRRANFFEADMDEMHNYVNDIMRLVAIDELPFKSLEFAIPFYPNISLRPKTLRSKDVRKTILTSLQQYLEHYAHA
jgi:hypothetical protein